MRALDPVTVGVTTLYHRHASEEGPENCAACEITRLSAANQDRRAAYEQLISSLRHETEARAAELLDLRERLDRPKCFYCEWGEEGERATPDQLRQHIETCAAHPMAIIKADLAKMRERAEKAEHERAEALDNLMHPLAGAEREYGWTWKDEAENLQKVIDHLKHKRDEVLQREQEASARVATLLALLRRVRDAEDPMEYLAEAQRVEDEEGYVPARAHALLDMVGAAEMLWATLANVSGGDWSMQDNDWREAAARWRDNYFASLARWEGELNRTVGQDEIVS